MNALKLRFIGMAFVSTSPCKIFSLICDEFQVSSVTHPL